jgi:hypothetical protein
LNGIQEVRGSIPLSSIQISKGLVKLTRPFFCGLYGNCIVGEFVGMIFVVAMVGNTNRSNPDGYKSLGPAVLIYKTSTNSAIFVSLKLVG